MSGVDIAGLLVERFSAEPITKLEAAAQGPASVLPNGTFFFVRKAGAPQVEPTGSRYHYVSSFAPRAHLAWIETIADARAFAAKFGERLPGAEKMMGIRWADVAREYHGVIVTKTPPVAEKDFATLGWFSAWDRPSACVWDPRALTKPVLKD